MIVDWTAQKYYVAGSLMISDFRREISPASNFMLNIFIETEFIGAHLLESAIEQRNIEIAEFVHEINLSFLPGEYYISRPDLIDKHFLKTNIYSDIPEACEFLISIQAATEILDRFETQSEILSQHLIKTGLIDNFFNKIQFVIRKILKTNL